MTLSYLGGYLLQRVPHRERLIVTHLGFQVGYKG